MINTIEGDLLSAKGIIVHGCNCQGVMGSGVAKAIKNKWPYVFESYLQRKDSVGLVLGEVDVCFVGGGTCVVNAMTQQGYGRVPGQVYVDYDAVRNAFRRINRHWQTLRLPVNFPLIGCGLGGGDWDIISEIIEDALDSEVEKNLWIL